MFRKDPLTQKRFIILILLLPLLLAALILGINHQTQDVPVNPLLASPPGLWVIVFVLFLIITSSLWFAIGTWKSTERRLETLSKAVDGLMEGDLSVSLTNSEEGIFSRLQGQFSTMSRRLQLTLSHLESEKEKQQALVTDISHQIKTPLASIKLYNSLIAAGGLSQEEENEFLQRIDDQIKKLEWLSASLTKISRLETGMIDLRMEPGDIKATIVAAINAVYLRALEKKVDIVLRDVSTTIINHDIKWTQEALVNILENAIKYVGEAGEITIGLEQLETFIKINVQDNGIGIPSHEIARIFDRFFRGESEMVKKAEGSGIGLYLSRKIIEEQGGGLTVTSTIGQGSIFSLLFIR